MPCSQLELAGTAIACLQYCTVQIGRVGGYRDTPLTGAVSKYNYIPLTVFEKTPYEKRTYFICAISNPATLAFPATTPETLLASSSQPFQSSILPPASLTSSIPAA